MATVAKDIVIECQKRGGGTPDVVSFAEGASQTFKKGWVVWLVAGYVVDPASDTPSLILGVAAEDAHNDAVAGTHQIGVYLALDTNVFSANVLQTGLADHVLVQGDIGTQMGIQRDTTNNRIFLNASVIGGANARVFTYELAQNQSATPNSASGPFGVGDTNVRLTFTFLEKFSQANTTS